jgi:RNA polymerase sigma-70 factor (ECF subfamily)
MFVKQRNNLDALALFHSSPITSLNRPFSSFHQDKTTLEKTHTLFWQNWLQFQPYLYRCCLKWLNYNPDLSQDLLHQGMLKAYQTAIPNSECSPRYKSLEVLTVKGFCINMWNQRNALFSD